MAGIIVSIGLFVLDRWRNIWRALVGAVGWLWGLRRLRPRSPLYRPRPGQDDIYVDFDGIRWRRGRQNYLSGWWANARCPEHETVILGLADDGSTAPYGQVVVGVIDPPRHPHCVAGDHDIEVTLSYAEASRRALVMLGAGERG